MTGSDRLIRRKAVSSVLQLSSCHDAICRAPIPRRQRPPTRELRPVAGGRGTTVAASGRTCSRLSGFHHPVIVSGAAARREASGQPWSVRDRAGWRQRGPIRASVIPALARPALQEALGRRGLTRCCGAPAIRRRCSTRVAGLRERHLAHQHRRPRMAGGDQIGDKRGIAGFARRAALEVRPRHRRRSL
jgi:hypothetical protein